MTIRLHTLTCSCGRRIRCHDESPDIHGPECCTCPPNTGVHLWGCPASHRHGEPPAEVKWEARATMSAAIRSYLLFLAPDTKDINEQVIGQVLGTLDDLYGTP